MINDYIRKMEGSVIYEQPCLSIRWLPCEGLGVVDVIPGFGAPVTAALAGLTENNKTYMYYKHLTSGILPLIRIYRQSFIMDRRTLLHSHRPKVT